ncbi:LPS export ABC transporter periplasmic protein LptC [Flavobacterium beibuense]|uniref:LPS export ABC transporter periplasmic protein LptC n=1 Tax=Flavobacterium beibuense F44-8 TaxID=1406840 RepID=A0A0A2LMQ5_9FLAO|nr:LPS export ABC transporter periplasmic protein LptC [Flavobacterium beibuense]KGO80483.1 hypothetical protein Q763_10725 [Flavobacterium beibuense F44-8]
MMLLKSKAFICMGLLAVVLASCESNLKDVQMMNAVAFSPAGQSEDINLKYTDSGELKAILESPLMLDFSNLDYGFNEFPKGVHVTMLDENGNKTFIESDYAISYNKTQLIDLQGNVKITSHDGKRLETQQLYYDQKNEWFYTEKNFKFTDEDGRYYEGPGIDFNKDFSIINAQQNSGEGNVDNIE